MNQYLTCHDPVKCCGCGACAHICPKGIISMEANYEGFYYPVVQAEQCIDCGKCARVCPVEKGEDRADKEHSKAFAAYSKNNEALMNSSSGGLFYEIAYSFISNGGVVCGATIDAYHQVYHTIIDTVENIPMLQGSKYVQSDLYRCFPEIGEALRTNRPVLFTGTPCQVVAVKRAFQSDRICYVDILCHGVPSQKLFNAYTNYLEKKYRGRLTEIVFRDKKRNGWSITQRFSIEKDGKKKVYYLDRHLSEYFSGFLRNMTQRESWYHCKYASITRVGDITLADFWGVDKVRPELYHFNGTSLVLVNSERGRELMEKLQDRVAIDEVTMEEATAYNINFRNPPERHPLRSTIYQEVFQHGFDQTVRRAILPKNAYKYRIWALLQALNLVGPLNGRN